MALSILVLPFDGGRIRPAAGLARTYRETNSKVDTDVPGMKPGFCRALGHGLEGRRDRVGSVLLPPVTAGAEDSAEAAVAVAVAVQPERATIRPHTSAEPRGASRPVRNLKVCGSPTRTVAVYDAGGTVPALTRPASGPPVAAHRSPAA